MPINTISITKKLNQTVANSKKFEGLARSAAETRLTFAKFSLMKDIDESTVSKDIVAACQNPSITQKDIISKGNIASAIGFNQGAEPIEDLKEVLSEGIGMNDKAKITISPKKVNFAYKVNIPTKRELYSILDGHGTEEWTSRSWLEMIENGISQLAKYIFWSEGFNTSNSRSGTGLQSKGDVRNEAKFTPQKNYLNDIFAKFKARFNK